jgi:hypothetical protein
MQPDELQMAASRLWLWAAQGRKPTLLLVGFRSVSTKAIIATELCSARDRMAMPITFKADLAMARGESVMWLFHCHPNDLEGEMMVLYQVLPKKSGRNKLARWLRCS